MECRDLITQEQLGHDVLRTLSSLDNYTGMITEVPYGAWLCMKL